MALVGVATIMLGGCAEIGQFGDPFGSIPSARHRCRDRPTADRLDRPRRRQQPSRSRISSRRRSGRSTTSRPLRRLRALLCRASGRPACRTPRSARSDRQRAARAAERAVLFRAGRLRAALGAVGARAVLCPARPRRRGIGGWSAEGGTPVVVAQGETADTIAQRYGVPTETLLQRQRLSTRAQVQPGARLTIPVYHAGGARSRRRRASGGAGAAAPRLASKSLAGEECSGAKQAALRAGVQKLAAEEPDASALPADKRAKLAQAKADQPKAASPRRTPPRRRKRPRTESRRGGAGRPGQGGAAATAKTEAAAAKTSPRPSSRRPSPRSCRVAAADRAGRPRPRSAKGRSRTRTDRQPAAGDQPAPPPAIPPIPNFAGPRGAA